MEETRIIQRTRLVSSYYLIQPKIYTFLNLVQNYYEFARETPSLPSCVLSPAKPKLSQKLFTL